jgi:ribosomal protein L7/L12
MFPAGMQRLRAVTSHSARRRVFATTPTTSQSFYHSSTRLSSAPAEDVVPIVWTTDRLSKDQIAKVDAIFHKVLWLDLFETSMLNELINQRLGLTMSPKQRRALQKTMDARAMGLKTGGGGQKEASTEAAEDEAPKTVDLKLESYDAKSKIKVIKEVRAMLGLGLKEAKELVESAPKVLQKELKPEEADVMKKKLEEIGATIELV